MIDEANTCKTCSFVISETDKHGETSYQCGRYPPIIINSSSPAMFPKVLSIWKCGEYSEKNNATVTRISPVVQLNRQS